tara:strand:- start:294 stop:722 length:429 start_codon:yes stop_codon:yes gene_type:complete
MELTISTRLVIPSNEIKWRFSRSSGSGGQNVNKTDSRVEIIFDIDKSKRLTLYQKLLLKSRLKGRIQKGFISIAVQEKRTQYQNRQLALAKLASLLRENLRPSTPARRVTTPTRASQKKRVDLKKKRGQLKKDRKFNIDNLS